MFNSEVKKKVDLNIYKLSLPEQEEVKGGGDTQVLIAAYGTRNCGPDSVCGCA